MEEQWLHHNGQTQINKVPQPAQNGLIVDHSPTAGKQHLPFTRLSQFHKPWCGHCLLCSLCHWPLSTPHGHKVRMQSFCHSQLKGPRACSCLLSKLGNLWKSGEKGPYRCSWHSRVTSLQFSVPRFTAADYAQTGHDPVHSYVWQQTSCGRRKPLPGQSHDLPSGLLLLLALCPTHPPALESPIRHLPISPHPHNSRLGTGLPTCWEPVHALGGG